jgi:cobalt-zinc-cadmium efflux system protein
MLDTLSASKAKGKRSLRGHEDEGIEGKLLTAAFVSVAILLAELIGGLLANSLALLSDAGHVFLDIFAVGLAYYAARVCRMPADHRFSFGMHRAEIVAALVNGLTLIVLALFIFYEAYLRFRSPPEVKGLQMLVVAVLGLFGNLIGIKLLHGHTDLNVRGAYLHILGDTISSIAVIGGAIAISYTGELRIDAIMSAFIGVLIIVGAGRLIRDSLEILLERTPRDIDPKQVRKKILSIEGVLDVHDMHIWSLCSSVRALNAHVVLDSKGKENQDGITRQVRHLLLDDFNVAHSTVQYESVVCCDPHEH